MTFWYRDSPASSGDSDWVVANNKNHEQTELKSRDVVQDKIFISALLKAPSDIYVQIGSSPKGLPFRGQKGFNHWSKPFNGQTGETTFTIERDGKTVSREKGRPIKNRGGRTNFNAWVGSF